MDSNLHSALATHTQVFPVLTVAQINRTRRSHLCGMQRWMRFCLRLMPAMSPFSYCCQEPWK